MTRALLRAICLLVALAHGGLAMAGEHAGVSDAGTPASQALQRKLDIVAMPVFGPVSLPAGGWGEVVVRIDNHGTEPAQGEVVAHAGTAPFSGGVSSRSTAPYSVGAGAAVSVRVPVRLALYSDPQVEVRAADGVLLHEQTFMRVADNHTLLVDVARASALGAALRGIPVGSIHDPWASAMRGWAPTTVASVVDVSSPLYDATTGDPILPRRAAGYARVSVVLMRSEELVRVDAAGLEALSSYLIAGGTLALVITRPEDARHPLMESLLGAPAESTAPAPATLAELDSAVPGLPTPYPPPPNARTLPRAESPEAEVRESLVGWRGGNARASAYGASAPYGLGEVHLLAFDPQSRPGVDSPWVQGRMVDLLRRANERLGGVLVRPGQPHQEVPAVRRLLDPNEGSRWAIVLTALLLCAYSIFAGPINFTYWRKKGHPLRALLWLPISAAVAFVAVAGVAVAAKGCSGRARHLTLVEAGGGMEVGSALRWRGFFVPSAQKLTVRTHSASSVIGTEIMSASEEAVDTVVVDREGLRLTELQMRPWETLVVREDGLASLGGGIALLPAGSEVDVVNQTGHRLRGLLLVLPNGDARFLDALEDGDRATSSAFASASGAVVGGHPRLLHDFDVYAISSQLDGASRGLADAWNAIRDSQAGEKDWFPSGVPVLLAQLEGGEGRAQDTGLPLDSDRVLLRIVGFGGKP